MSSQINFIIYTLKDLIGLDVGILTFMGMFLGDPLNLLYSVDSVSL